VLLLFRAPAVWACSCEDRSTAELYSDATAVFVARITKAEMKSGSAGLWNAGKNHIEVSYSLVEAFKGNPASEGLVLDADYGGGNCSIGFKVSAVYVIFLYGNQHVHYCGGTRGAYGSSILDDLRDLASRSGQ